MIVHHVQFVPNCPSWIHCRWFTSDGSHQQDSFKAEQLQPVNEPDPRFDAPKEPAVAVHNVFSEAVPGAFGVGFMQRMLELTEKSSKGCGHAEVLYGQKTSCKSGWLLPFRNPCPECNFDLWFVMECRNEYDWGYQVGSLCIPNARECAFHHKLTPEQRNCLYQAGNAGAAAGKRMWQARNNIKPKAES